MRKIFLLLLIYIYSSVGFSQILLNNTRKKDNSPSPKKLAYIDSLKKTLIVNDKSNKIEGIGAFTINKSKIEMLKTLRLLEEAKYESKVSLDSYYSEFVLDSVELKYNSELYPLYCPNIRVFHFPNYELNSIFVKEIYVVFYKGILVKFTANMTDELKEALILKYGNPISNTKEKLISCVYNLTGIKTQYKEYTITEKWNNTNLVAEIITKKFYDNDCNESYVSTITIEDKTKIVTIDQLNKSNKQKLISKIQQKKKDKLKDL